MPKLVIEGREISVPEGTTVLEAARKLGFEIPTFCHHPGLSVAGNCRMCLVEVANQPRLASSCSLKAEEGMVVHINSPKAVEGRRAVIEFLLANHPLDCPICDRAGECALQDHAMAHGVLKSRFAPPKVSKPKAQDIGRHVVLDAERCIICTRCVRFVDEISRTSELGVFGRGNKEQLALAPGKRLDNPYSGNVVDLCPVGALTAKEFRFKSRVWFLRSTNSICPSCARGCNIQLDTRKPGGNGIDSRRLYRIRPRFNPHVNGHWMCDEGRFRFSFVDEDRVTRPAARIAGKRETLNWEDALASFRKALKESQPERTGILLSGESTLEDLFMAREFVSQCLKGAWVAADCPAGRLPSEDDFLIMRDKFPNAAGAALLGFSGGGWVEILDRTARGEMDTLIVVGHDLGRIYPQTNLDLAISRVKNLVAFAQNGNDTVARAHLVLPIASFAERTGTWINGMGRLQAFSKALEPMGEARPEWEIWREMLGRHGRPFMVDTEEQVFASLARSETRLAGLSYGKIGERGVAIGAGAAPGGRARAAPEGRAGAGGKERKGP